MQNEIVDASRSPTRELGIVRQLTELLIPGDRVTIPTEDVRVYRIIHISNQKAWVRPVQEGRQQIIGTGDLRLIRAERPAGSRPN